MPRLTRKADLLARFEEAIRLSGWNVLYLTHGDHPARYKVYKDGESYTVRVYIWNISHGGAGRSSKEYRIQVTGFSQFAPEPNGRTLILGWWEDVGVFAGWDYRHHKGTLGGSPSMQISEDALRQARLTGFASYVNQKGETAIAFRPDFAATYVNFLEPLHDSGAIPAEAEILEIISDDPDAISDADIEAEIGEKRKYAVIETKKALRANDFARRVLGAYGHRCAMCDVQLKLIDGAHILPVGHEDSLDTTNNGVALCALHHRAYDRGLVTFGINYMTYQNAKLIRELKADDRAGGLKEFAAAIKPMINVPPDKKDRPAPKFVTKANELRNWSL
jgi:putative restriction endonuclease